MNYLPPIVQILLALMVATAAVYDIRYRRIPNRLVLGWLLLGIGLNIFLYETPGLRSAGLGMGLALLIYFPLYLVRAMGAGDAKLMAAIGAIVGPGNWLGIFFISAFLGGAVAVGRLLGAGRLRHTVLNAVFILKQLTCFRAPYAEREELDVNNPKAITLPHGAVVAGGALAFLAAAAIWAPR